MGGVWSTISSLPRLLRKPGFWLILGLFLVITLAHYEEDFVYSTFLMRALPNLGLSRHAFERVLYLVPIVWAGFLFGVRGTAVATTIALVVMLPRALFLAEFPKDSLFEMTAILLVGSSVSSLVAYSVKSLRREREYLSELELTHQRLEANVEVIKENEKRLTALNEISRIVSRSLELKQILGDAIDNVAEVMEAEAALLFLLEPETGELVLSAHRGVAEEFVQNVDRLIPGEGFNGKVAQTGQALFVEDCTHDPGLARAMNSKQIHAALIVPLSSKGRVNGTLCVAVRNRQWFQPEERELLIVIGSQIGVAVENPQLYQKQQEIADKLRVSEQRYRELFENAHDAIWLHDLDGNIIAANRAAVALTGYTLEELFGLNAIALLEPDSGETIKKVEERLVKGELAGSIDEIKLVKKDRTEAFIQVASSLVFGRGEPLAFQHIARDITQEKRMQENLHFYLQQATRAQEEERKRISRELHDDTIQALVVLSRQLDILASQKDGLSDVTRDRLEGLRQQTNGIMQGVRRLSQDLRPAALDRLGLLAALEWLAADVTQYSGVATKVNVIGTERRFPEEVELVLFRIVQEALRNVWRHSQATDANIEVQFEENKTRITVSDNGRGFNLPESIGDLAKDGKLGLAGMQERARLIGGTLKVQSQLSKGCTISVELPN